MAAQQPAAETACATRGKGRRREALAAVTGVIRQTAAASAAAEQPSGAMSVCPACMCQTGSTWRIPCRQEKGR
jgi:hypothetical protein